MSTTELLGGGLSENQLRKSYGSNGGEHFLLTLSGSSRDGVNQLYKYGRDRPDTSSRIKTDIAKSTLDVLDGLKLTRELGDTCCLSVKKLVNLERE